MSGVAIVTGASRGIGAAIAERLLRDGFRVVIVDLDSRAGRATRVGLAADHGDNVAFVRADITSKSGVARLVRNTKRQYGRIDVMVANAGIAISNGVLETTARQTEQLLSVNLKGTLNTIQEAGRAMKAHGGRIVAVASTNAFWMEGNMAVYNATKAAIVALIRTAAMELGPTGITVNAVAPGVIVTRMTEPLRRNRAAISSYLKQIPLGRLGSPADIASAVAFLVSADAAWITGHVLVVDGGQTMGTALPPLGALPGAQR